MNEHQLLELTRKGEGLDPEFKTCRNQISRDVYETVCAFLNRHGGTILLGVQDSGEETVTPKVTPEVGTKLALSRTKQKYRLTEKGRQVLAGIIGDVK